MLLGPKERELQRQEDWEEREQRFPPSMLAPFPGILICFAIFLSARGLKAGQFQACLDVVKKLESKNCVSQLVKLLPSHRDFFIKVRDNAVDLEALQECVSLCEIRWSRTGVFF